MFWFDLACEDGGFAGFRRKARTRGSWLGVEWVTVSLCQNLTHPYPTAARFFTRSNPPASQARYIPSNLQYLFLWLFHGFDTSQYTWTIPYKKLNGVNQITSTIFKQKLLIAVTIIQPRDTGLYQGQHEHTKTNTDAHQHTNRHRNKKL